MDGTPQSLNLADHRILGIPAETSLGFLEAVFDCYAQDRLFSILRPGTDTSGLGQEPRPVTLPSPPVRGWGRLSHRPRHTDAPAQIVFTSGTEGRPKPIVLSHRNLADVVHRLNAVMELTEEVREYVGVPVSYSFGLGRVRAVAAAGGAFYLPERFDPTEIAAMLEAGEINAISAVPSLWRLVLADPDPLRGVADRVRWIEIGSQYMSGAEKAAMAALFPAARIVQHYGLTEASRSTFLRVSGTDADVLEAVGAAEADGVEIAIGPEGEIRIRGPHVALGQAAPDGSVTPLADADGWLTTRDRGEIREGRLHYLGRLDDQINVGGMKLGAETLEEDIRRLVPAAAGGFAVAPRPDPLRGETVLLGVEARISDLAPLLREAATLAMTRRGLPGRNILHLVTVPHLPRTATDKIQRRQLADMAGAEEAGMSPQPEIADAPPLTEDQARIAALWRKVLPVPHVAPDQSFHEAGGDSLSGVQVGLVMERAGAARAEIRATLEGRPLAEVARAADAAFPDSGSAPETRSPGFPEAARRIWAVGMARGVMVLMVLLSHWGPGIFQRLGLAETLEPPLRLLYRSGTPGFAAVFGIGIGAFMVGAFRRDAGAVLRRQRMSFWLVLSGLLLLAGAQILLNVLSGRALTGQVVAWGLYGVLAYYAIALITGPAWMPLVARLRRPGLSLPLVALGLWALWLMMPWILPAAPLPSLLEFPRLMGLGIYSIPKLAGITCFGIAIGLWLASCRDTATAARGLMALGGGGAAFALAVTIQSYGIAALSDGAHPAFVSLPATAMYICLVAAMTGAFLWVMGRWETIGPGLAMPLRLLVVIGGLALPIYVFHGLVIPVKDILVTLGLPEGPSLALSLGTFLLSMGLAGRRLYRMHFV